MASSSSEKVVAAEVPGLEQGALLPEQPAVRAGAEDVEQLRAGEAEVGAEPERLAEPGRQHADALVEAELERRPGADLAHPAHLLRRAPAVQQRQRVVVVLLRRAGQDPERPLGGRLQRARHGRVDPAQAERGGGRGVGAGVVRPDRGAVDHQRAGRSGGQPGEHLADAVRPEEHQRDAVGALDRLLDRRRLEVGEVAGAAGRAVPHPQLVAVGVGVGPDVAGHARAHAAQTEEGESHAPTVRAAE